MQGPALARCQLELLHLKLTLLWHCRAFSAAEARQHRLFPTKPTGESARRNQIQLGSQIFEDGYAIRDVAIKSLDPLGGAPAVDELQRFNEVSFAACLPHIRFAGPVHLAGKVLSLGEGHALDRIPCRTPCGLCMSIHSGPGSLSQP